jgi:hypothetical protein
MKIIDLFEEITDEEIKGWKNAHSDLNKMRQLKSNDAKSIKLVRLKNDGSESKMHDSTKMFNSREEAEAHHARLVSLNPTRSIRHNMHHDGKITQLDEVYPGQSSGKLKNYVKKKYGDGDITCGKAAKVKSSNAPKSIKNRASWYQSLHCK